MLCADSRAVSNVIGVLLILGFIMAGLAAATATGTLELDNQRDALDAKIVTEDLSSLADAIEEVALGTADSKNLELHFDKGGVNAQADVLPTRGHVTVELVSGGSSTRVVDSDLGTVQYTNDDTQVAYQGGAVFTQAGEAGATMVDEPPFSIREREGGTDTTVTMPIMLVRSGGDGQLDSGATVRQDSYSRVSNPRIDGSSFDTLRVTITSDYADAWARYFRNRVEYGGLTVTGSSASVTVEMDIPNSENLYLQLTEYTLEIADH